MSERTRVSHPIYNLLPTEIEGFDSLVSGVNYFFRLTTIKIPVG